MNTFLIFVFVFGLFGWCLWQLLSFTKNTIGENSPLKVVREYQTGDQSILSDKMPGIEVIHEYFKKIPTEYRQERFPYIK
jgi:hypothetical protein